MKQNLNNIDKVKSIISYYNEYPELNNTLEKLNMGENSISQLLAWLLDTNWTNEEKYNKTENQIHREFAFEFLKLIKENESNSNKSILQDLDNNQLMELAKGIITSQDENNIDILLVNKDKKFVCVIENKKRAKLSTSKTKNGNQRLLQIEKYHRYIDENYKNYDKKYVYLCAELDDLEKTIDERITDVRNVPQYIQEHLVFMGQKFDDFKNNSIKWALEQLNYTAIWHKELVLSLYKLLRKKENCSDLFDKNSIIKGISEDVSIELAKKLLNFYTKNNDDTNVIKIPGNAKIRFYTHFSELDYKTRLQILSQYIEYWELHSGDSDFSDNLLGYTKIIDGEYLWDILQNLKEDEEDWKQVLDLAKTSTQLEELIQYL